jgi:uncharacterized protein (TIGR02647 family)
MSYNEESLAELQVLMLFSDRSKLEGIKIHQSADPGLISAAQRLFESGLLTQSDGGYLTSLGGEAADHAQALLSLLAGPQS